MFNKKLPVISFVLYVIAGILALFTIWSFLNIHSYIASQQVSFSGNEYSIISYYMTSAGQYLIFAIILFSLGWILQKFSPVTVKETPELENLSTFDFETAEDETVEDETAEDETTEDETVDDEIVDEN